MRLRLMRLVSVLSCSEQPDYELVDSFLCPLSPKYRANLNPTRQDALLETAAYIGAGGGGDQNGKGHLDALRGRSSGRLGCSRLLV